MYNKIRLGELLLKNLLITDQQLEEALEVQRTKGGKLGTILVQLGMLDENTLLDLIANQQHVPFIELLYYKIKPKIIQKLPETIARRFRVLVLDGIKDSYLIAMADPSDLVAIEEVNRILNKVLRICLVRESDLIRVIDEVYRRTEEISSFAIELDEEISAKSDKLFEEEAFEAQDAPVVKMIDSIFEDAVQVRASDIHIEPDETVLRVRQRVDGLLAEHVMQEKKIAAALVSRLKLMASLNISEKRLPQDGRFSINVKNHKIDVRLSTMPTQFGEAAVMRLLDPNIGLLDMEELGMSEQVLLRFRNQINRPHGLVLVTGPTGSGKTTTLYAALNELNQATKKIISIEDPIEYSLERINQIQVNPKIELTFAKVLRSALRHDPDIIMVGEMRDVETAKIGIRSSLTGHLVLSTLHTNDAISSALRLIDMGVEGYMVASALRCIIAQRLLRRVCDFCREDYQPTQHELVWVESTLSRRQSEADDSARKFIMGKGCARCANTGYRGRIGIFELLEIDEDMIDALRLQDSSGFAKAAMRSESFITLVEAGILYALAGVTSLHEVFRVAGEVHESTVKLQ